MEGVRDEVSIIYAAQWPLFPQTLQTQFRVRRFSVAGASRRTGSVYYAALCLLGRRYCP